MSDEPRPGIFQSYTGLLYLLPACAIGLFSWYLIYLVVVGLTKYFLQLF
jgi:hypothetical protein